MAKKAWAKFPLPNGAFDYAGDKLAKIWPKLHAGDREPFPDEKRVAALLGKKAKNDIASELQDAWRAFHRGDFQDAHDRGVALGAIGASVAIKAGGIHATYLAEEGEKTRRYAELAEFAETAIAAFPNEANSHYRRAFALGRYSQCISIAKALSQGLGGKVRDSLDKTLEIAPDHAEAHTALGLYHAEIVAKVGSMLAKLTYGATSANASRHIEQALKLTPEAPIVWIERGNALLLLHGEREESAVAEAYDKAAKLKPRDAMEALDAQWARDQLE